MQDISQLKYGSASNLSNTDIEMLEDCDRLDNESIVHESETKENSSTFGSDFVPLDEALNLVASRLREENVSAKTMVQDEGIQAEICEEKAKTTSGTHSFQYEVVEIDGGSGSTSLTDLLKHDKVLSKKPPTPHRVVPDYLLNATTKEASKRVKLANLGRCGFKKKFKQDKDPLKSFSAQLISWRPTP